MLPLMFKAFVIIASVMWASLLLISWGSTAEPPITKSPVALHGSQTS